MTNAYIGYDLGDGETITDITILDDRQTRTAVQTLFVPMEMPDNNTPGQAIPTAFAYDENGQIVFASSILDDPAMYREICINFKRCPSDMVRKVEEKRANELIDIFEKGWPKSQEAPEVNFEKLEKFASAVITFTNAVFSDGKYYEKVHDAIVSCDSVMFCVGHPTRWSRLDVAIYKAILSRSVLGKGVYAGKPSQLILDAESRAAYLYVRDKTTAAILPKGKAALLIDVGSSTIDITATTSDSRNHLYNSGNNYLGVRSIDFLIRNWYLDKLKQDDDDWAVYQELISRNPTMKMALTLSCRKAKEDIYSLAAKKSRIVFADFAPVRLTQDDVNELVTSRPIASVLKESVEIPDDVVRALENKTWITLFREFVKEQKANLQAQHISVGRIILTGSASKMPFVKEVICDEFSELGEDGVLSDLNPSRSISMGLALVGPNDITARLFEARVNEFIKDGVPDCVDKSIPSLADSIGSIVESVIFGIVKKRMNEWKNGEFSTLNDMTKAIENDCSEKQINSLLQNDPRYGKAINDWAVNQVGKDVAVALKAICDRFGVTDLTVDQLNVLTIPDVAVGDSGGIPSDVLSNAIAAVVAVIASIVLYIILPTVLLVVLNIIAFISVDIAILLCDLLLLIPGAGWMLLIGIAGVVVFNALKDGGGEAKRKVTELIKKTNLPNWARKLISDEKLDKKLAQENIKDKVKKAILEDDTKRQISSSIAESLRSQIEGRIEEIKYKIK